MPKRKHEESELQYFKRKLKKLKKRLKNLPPEREEPQSPPHTPPPSHSPLPPPPSPPPPPPNQEEAPVNGIEAKRLEEDEPLTIVEDDALPEEFLLALGTEGEENVEIGPDIRPELSARWRNIMSSGLGKEALEQIIKKYPAPGNFCKDAPKINPEIMASLSEVSLKRDKRIVQRQNLTLRVMSALGKTLTNVLRGNINSNTIIEQVNDAAKLCAELFYEDSSSRRYFALAGANQTIKEAVQDTKPDEFIFGKECAEKIKAAQAIKKTGLQIKNPLPSTGTKPAAAKPAPQNKRPGNWRGPPQQYQQHRARGGLRAPPTTRKYNQPHPRDQQRHQYRGRQTHRRR